MKILLVDDHQLVRDGLQQVLSQLAEEVSILEAPDGNHCLLLMAQHPDLDLLLLDVNLPDRNGLQLLDEIRNQFPEVPVMMLSAFEDQARIQSAMEKGAVGFISKSSSSEVILNALRLVISGGIYLPPQILDGNTTNLPTEYIQTVNKITDAASANAMAIESKLTQRQMQVLQLMMSGKPNKTIGKDLNLAPGTVKIHVSAILKALGATSRTYAVVKAIQLGLGPTNT